MNLMLSILMLIVGFLLDVMDGFAITHLKEMGESGITVVVFELTPSIANDAVIRYIEDKFEEYDVRFTRIAQGVPIGVSLENVDMLSLARALEDSVRT